MNRELNFLKEKLNKNETVVVACSGGPDSMCLLSLLIKLKEEYNLNIIVAHVNHKIRIESDEEEEMVHNFVTNNLLTWELLRIDEYKNGNFSESDARSRRYIFFDEVIKKHQGTTLLTAHHGYDLIETILMRITRGSNLKGYIGIKMESKNENYKILRPLLSTTKEEIIKYLKDNNIPYRIDKSNNNLEYTRNRYRHIVLPFLKKEQENIHEKYLGFSKELESYYNFVIDYINKNKLIVDNKVVINKVINESKFIKEKCLELLIEDIQKIDILDISKNGINELMNLYNSKNKSIDINNNYIGVNDSKYIYITKKEKRLEEVIFDKDIKINNFNFYYNTIIDGDNTIYIDSKDIKLPLKIRGVNNKDRIEVEKIKGSVKVSDILKNSKIPKEKRNSYPLIVDSNNKVIWIPYIIKSKFIKDKLEKYDIIIRCEAR